MKQEELIKTDWDIILLLDALRFDYFSKYRKRILKEGKLTKAISPVTATPPWFFEMFPEKREDVTFISMDFELSSHNTHFISIGYRLKYGNKPYNMTKFFGEVIDMWDGGVDKKLGVLPPEIITDKVISFIKENPDRKVIANYFQVHDPYLYYLNKGELTVIDMEKLGGRGRPEYNRYTLRNLKEFTQKFLSDETVWILRKKLGFEPEGGLAEVWLKYGKLGIIKGYVEDLKYTLNNVKKVKEAFPDKKIIITSDHGERLGENGRYGHGGKTCKHLQEVPWFEM